jgi:CubicO group peptidase (beta-lactamase class C family)
MRTDHIAGLSVAVVRRDRDLLVKGYGIAASSPERPVEPASSLFQIASLSKTFTWMALLQQVEAGTLNLQAPVNQYLPENLRIPDDGFSTPIRVVDLMSHAEGFEDNDLTSMPSTDQPEDLISVREYLERNRPRRVREPGLLSGYSNYGVALAGVILEQVSGQDYASYFEQHMFAPLGLKHTTSREPYPAREGLLRPMPAELADNVVTGFRWQEGRFVPARFEYISAIGPAGSINTTASDMARMMRMQLNDGSIDGTRIYGEVAARALRTPILQMPEGISGWAHGYMTTRLGNGFIGYGHGGASSHFLTYMMLVPEADVGVFISTNTNTGLALIMRFPELVVGYLANIPASMPRPGVKSLREEAWRYTGEYVSTRRAAAGLAKLMGLIGARQSVRVSDDGFLITGSGARAQAWVPTDIAGVFQSSVGSERIAFKLDESGRATHYVSALGADAMLRTGGIFSAEVFWLVVIILVITSILVVVNGVLRRADGSLHSIAEGWFSRVNLAVGGTWVLAIALALIGLMLDSDEAYRWPNAILTLASFAALVASVTTVALVVLLPRAARRNAMSPWSIMQMCIHSSTTVVFVAAAVVLAVWGGLSPWS